MALVGNYLPRRCGIATFTHDLHKAVASAVPDVDAFVVAMTDHGQSYDYPKAVRFDIRDSIVEDYSRAADDLNAEDVDVVSLQHEYGIFGGPAGQNVVDLATRLRMPLVTTLHTVLPQPSSIQKSVLDRLIDVSSKVVVMSETGRQLLRSVHDVPDAKIAVIAHGIPDFPFLEPDDAKAKLGYAGRTILLTFGLLSPNKGIEYMIDAMPAIIRTCPNVTYVVLGATHPNLLREDGEAYRESLIARIDRLGVRDHVVFLNEFVEQERLLEFISMCDVYVTPYLAEAQMTSGTLAYSYGLGKPVVSTPYWHAKELLANGAGVLVPFADAAQLSVEICTLLTSDPMRNAMRARAYAESRSMIWAKTAEKYVDTMQDAQSLRRPASVLAIAPRSPRMSSVPRGQLPLQHFVSLCDSTGISQHAVHSIPDRAHGYCVDDNARALLLSNAMAHSGECPLSDTLTTSFAAFVQHAWNGDTQRFRNFMSYDRRWLEPTGSEDSHGRTLGALGECVRKDSSTARRGWAEDLFCRALAPTLSFSSPRAQAFTLLGIDAYAGAWPDDEMASSIRATLADRLMHVLEVTAPQGQPGALSWCWFEDVLAYDNARLPQALIQTGQSTGNAAYQNAGLRTLRWLARLQTASSGCFRPVGSHSFGRLRGNPLPFDQQPLEAWASISAYIAAWHADGDGRWITEAARAFEWFSGCNDLHQALIDPETGGCCDGLHPDRKNLNQGAESCLSYLNSLVEMRELQRLLAASARQSLPKPVSTAQVKIATRTGSGGGNVVSNTILEPPSLAPASRPGSRGGSSVQARN